MKRWQKVELKYLERHADDKSLEELAERFGTDPKTVAKKLEELRKAQRDDQGAADASLAAYAEGLKALHEQRWKAASEAFGTVLGDAEATELHARARAFARLAAERTGVQDSSPPDPYLSVVAALNDGDLEAARKGCVVGDAHRSDERFAYLLSVVEARRGEEASAAESLGRAIELEPKNRWRASQDVHLVSMRERHPDLFG